MEAATGQSLEGLLSDEHLRLTTAERVAPPREKRRAAPTPGDFALPAEGYCHEWHLMEDVGSALRKAWHAPLTLLAGMALSLGEGGRVLWIGRRCWPMFQHLCAASCGATSTGGEAAEGGIAWRPGWRKRFVFLDPQTDEERFWARGEALRCPAVSCVVADASRMAVTVSRRLQLAAEAGNAVGLLARPWWEAEEPSCAATRWRVMPRASVAGERRWQVELHRCRGQQVEQDAPRRWIAEWSYQVFCGTGALHFSADVGCGSAAAQSVRQRSHGA